MTATPSVTSKGPAGERAQIDLDGDGTPEAVFIRTGVGGVRIVDSETTYQSRDKWRVVTTAVGDTDRDGRPEIAALVDGTDGRHLVLFAWHAGRYKERLVSSTLTPVPLGLAIRFDPGSGGDVIDLREALGTTGDTALTTYRWNGFGYTAVAATGAS